jgi:general secretion pathway protein N
MISARVVIALLALLCVALGGLAVAELSGSGASAPEASGPSASAAAKSDPAAPNPSFSLPALGSYASVSQRPLFSPDRRPAARSADNAGAWSSFALAGIIITPQSREALVSHGKPPTVAHLAEGQTIEGWTVTAIYPDHVVFRDRLTEHELRLIDKSPPPPASPSQPGQPAQRRQAF